MYTLCYEVLSPLVSADVGTLTLRISITGADQSARSAQDVPVIDRPLGLSSCWLAGSPSAEGADEL